MKFFIDAADAAEIADLASGPVGGDTTNCSLVAKTGRSVPADKSGAAAE